MKILFITTDWNTPYRIATGEYGGVGYYRAYGPAKALRKLGYDVDVKGYNIGVGLDKTDAFTMYKQVFAPYDVVVMKQADTSNAGKMIGACKDLGIPIVMDLDDLITEIDEDNPAIEQGYEKGGAKRAMAIASLSMVDALFVTSQPLKDEYQKFLQDVHKIDMPTYVLPNCCDKDLWTKINKEKDDNVVIGWHGSITHDSDISIVLPAMKELMKKHENLYLSLTGGIRQETYDEMFVKFFTDKQLERIAINRGTESFKHFPQYLSRHPWDIGIAPLRDTKFSRGKSHIKWLEYSLIGIPTVASNVYPYAQVIEDGVTGYLANDDEWFKVLDQLIADKKKGVYVGRDAHKHVIETHQYEHHAHKWVGAFESVLEAGSKSLL